MATRKNKPFPRDPFAVDPLPKAHYHPTPEKQLNKHQRSTAVNLKCSVDLDDAKPDPKPSGILSPADELFLKGTNSFQTRPFDWQPVDDDGNLDETWPASERPSSISLTGLEDSQVDLEDYQSIVERFVNKKHGDVLTSLGQERRRMPGTAGPASGSTGQTSKSKIPVRNSRPEGNQVTQGSRYRHKTKQAVLKKDTAVEETGSVLQQYIERFRNSAPTSREERLKKSQNPSKDFWWLSDSAASPSESYEQPDSGRKMPEEPVPDQRLESSLGAQLTVANMEKYKHLQELQSKQKTRRIVPESPGDKRTVELQRRAEQLLEKSVSSVASTEPAVSTEGLGSNMSDMSSMEEYSYRPKFAKYLESDQPVRPGIPPPMPGQRPLPDSDPLQQWRLRRRMEQAQQSAPQNMQNFNFLSKSDHEKKMDTKLEEFKQRLAGKTVGKLSNNVHFTPTPQVKQVSDPLQIQTSDDQDLRQPQIASPSLRPCRPKNDPAADVDPHLHLMCDLLPCPHRGQYQPYTADTVSSELHGSKFTDKGDNYDGNEKGDKYCDKKINDEKQYRQFLEAEKPDIDSERPESGSRKNWEDSEYTFGQKHRDLEQMVQDIVINDEKAVEKSDSFQSEHETSDGKKRIKKKEDSLDERSDKQTRKQSDINTSEMSRKGKTDKRKDDSEEAEVTGKVIKPKHSSSPNMERKGVNAAIGQVVKEHLFSTSTSTVLSSVESLPPSASVERNTGLKKTVYKPSVPKQTSSTEAEPSVDSDGEFPEDEMLVMLRKQRAFYEQQLNDIDRLLGDLDR